MQIEISGIKIELQKKDIKNLHLVVVPPDGKVRVSAPMHLSDESIRMFVRTKLGWIKKQQEKFKISLDNPSANMFREKRFMSSANSIFCMWSIAIKAILLF